MTRWLPRWVLGVVLLVAVLGAVAGGGAWAAFQDTGPAEVNVSVDTFTVSASIDSVQPAELNTSNSTEGPVTVQVSLPAPDDVDTSSVTAEFKSGNGNTVSPTDSNCGTDRCTFKFSESDIESLADNTGNFTLVISGEYTDGSTFESDSGQNQVELCDGNCDDSVGSLNPVQLRVGSSETGESAGMEVTIRG